MAEENDSSQEKSEEPTQKRIEKAREDGNVARSQELNVAMVMIVGVIAFLGFAPMLGADLGETMRQSFSLQRAELFDPNVMLLKLTYAAYRAIRSLAPFFAFLLIATLLGPILMGGWNFSAKALTPNLKKLNPVEGLKKMFSLKSLIELVKATAKVTVVGGVAVWMLYFFQGHIFTLHAEDLKAAIAHSATILAWAVIALVVSLLLIAAIDVPWQLWDYKRKLKMTKQEIKDEHKDTNGKPEVKQRIRQLQHEMAQARMMSDVPNADVVITNPEHYAVALTYNMDGTGAPVVVAKGLDLIAFKIREVAAANDVEIVESPPLARAIYHTTDIDREIPSELYIAVAQVLAYVFQLRSYRRGKGQRPKPLRDVPVPEEMQYD